MNKKSAPKYKKVTLNELFDVLSFYADKENYYSLPTPVLNDNGKKARKILKRLLKEQLDIINK